MAGTKEIKTHIQSVGETRKITNAMYLIASTKLQRARQELDQTRPYFEALQGEIKRIFRTAYDVDSPYFYPLNNDAPLEGTYGCLVITADKGLAGAYNQNAIREALRLLERNPDTKLFVVGEYGRRFFAQR
ncbi:MAG: F0F1 ATP synthase subunit gamma, partial [Oscillibacter sp.]|nr:F0F1 ATP synthase subunit gamma [Oscillibacter sp.]